MADVTPLDTVIVKETISEQDGTKVYLPFAYFKEPQNEKNYYLLQHNEILEYPYDKPAEAYLPARVFPYYVVDDKILAPYVNGLAAHVITADRYPYVGGGEHHGVFPGQPVQLRLSSLTKGTYEYFNSLARQFREDGNVFKPAPSSAVGNISNGALGIFWATTVSHKLALP